MIIFSRFWEGRNGPGRKTSKIAWALAERKSLFFPELNEPARPAAARPASRDASRPAPGGASALRTERRRRIEDPTGGDVSVGVSHGGF
jgi:hypothetical protein